MTVNKDDTIYKLNKLIPKMSIDQKLQAISEIAEIFQTEDYEPGYDQEFVEICMDLDDESVAVYAMKALLNSIKIYDT